jgi:hypothetical protein
MLTVSGSAGYTIAGHTPIACELRLSVCSREMSVLVPPMSESDQVRLAGAHSAGWRPRLPRGREYRTGGRAHGLVDGDNSTVRFA